MLPRPLFLAACCVAGRLWPYVARMRADGGLRTAGRLFLRSRGTSRAHFGKRHGRVTGAFRRGCGNSSCARGLRGTVLPNAASPMEARLGLMLSMPRRLGGYGLPPPRLNLRFDVEGEARRVSDKRFYRGDLCWEEARVALEYDDSDAAHTGSERIAADTKRRNALVYMGVTVLGVTRRQAFDFGELDKVACILAKLLGVTLRERRSVPERSDAERAARQALRDDALGIGVAGGIDAGYAKACRCRKVTLKRAVPKNVPRVRPSRQNRHRVCG